MSPAVKCLLLLLVVAILFITEIIPLAVTAMGASVACWILGLIPEKQIFLGLADSTVVLFAGMFVVGAAMFHTGVAQKIGAKVVRVCGTSENRLMLGLMLVAAVMSAFLSNTGTTACLIPVVMSICATAKISPSRQLMPLAFAAALGGTCTLIGTPPNMLANVALKAAGMPELQFGFFEYAYIGIPITVAGILYMMLIGKHLLPNNLATDVDELEFAEDDAAAISHKASRQIICGIILVGVID